MMVSVSGIRPMPKVRRFRILRAVPALIARMMVPGDERLGTPGADDDVILADMVLLEGESCTGSAAPAASSVSPARSASGQPRRPAGKGRAASAEIPRFPQHVCGSQGAQERDLNAWPLALDHASERNAVQPACAEIDAGDQHADEAVLLLNRIQCRHRVMKPDRCDASGVQRSNRQFSRRCVIVGHEYRVRA